MKLYRLKLKNQITGFSPLQELYLTFFIGAWIGLILTFFLLSGKTDKNTKDIKELQKNQVILYDIDCKTVNLVHQNWPNVKSCPQLP